MYEKILVPLDGSKVGEAALPYVEALITIMSPKTKVDITLLQVISPTTRPFIAGGEEEMGTLVIPTADEIERGREKALDYLNGISEGLIAKGATVKTMVSIGNAAEEIINTEEKIKANLVAMSTHGWSGIKRWAFGSVTDKVLRSGAVPVLTVRARE